MIEIPREPGEPGSASGPDSRCFIELPLEAAVQVYILVEGKLAMNDIRSGVS